MAWKFSLKGGRSWWGKREAKKAGNVTRRREEHDLTGRELVAMWDVATPVEVARQRVTITHGHRWLA